MVSKMCVYILFSIGIIIAGVSADTKCDTSPGDVPEDWIDIKQHCTDKIEEQIKKEITASFKYLAVASHFARDTVNRPGFAEFFFKSAREEREHGIKLVEYLSMRGKLTNKLDSLFVVPDVSNIIDGSGKKLADWDGATALKYALALENDVTLSIRNVIEVCENVQYGMNHYHVVDFLSGEYLPEQFKSERELAGYLSTLTKMLTNHGALGEFLFDKTLLE